ncbi:uncharacterized protein LOC132061119 [Lycium ferocissimum]|uniref:uncharacterized protein LOC132061119 n=1 Tax=Lycium ferocissimum TaxID=112874 RepID=UPI002815BBEA|nr:uncharacterized protein LOC132061119 [Lycium ferocissimum]
MKIATWNVRGFNKVFNYKEFLRVIKKEQIDIIAVVEHRVLKLKAKQIISKVVPGWKWAENYGSSDRGRIWILWKPEVMDVSVIHVENQMIHCLVKCVSGKNPWLVMGDFNAVLRGKDRLGSQVMDAKIRDFDNIMDQTNLTELRSIGRFYTWTNNHVHNKIDRALVNPTWMNLWPQYEAIAMYPYFSDHSLLCITIEDAQTQGPKPFKFLNHLAKHPTFLQHVNNNWKSNVQGTPMERIWKNFKLMKGSMMGLNTKEFSNVESKIPSIRQQLEDIQKQLRNQYNDQALYTREKELKLGLEKWIIVEESILRQKFRIQWLGLGDTNSAFFFASMKSRICQNHITRLVAKNGIIRQTRQEIEVEIIDFYKQLLGSNAKELPVIQPSASMWSYSEQAATTTPPSTYKYR